MLLREDAESAGKQGIGMSMERDVQMLLCSSCGAQIDICHFCDEVGCPKAVCYTCISVALRQMERQPHAHGG